MAIPITEQIRLYRNEPILTRDSVATITDRNNIPVEERFNGIKTIVRSEGKRYEIIYSGNFNSLSTAAKNAFLADNNNWKEVVSNAALDLKEDKTNKGVANGYTPLGADTKIPLQYIPDSLLGALEYKGVWSATTNTAPHGSPENGWYYKVNVAGQTTFTGSTVDWAIGDWIIYNGTTWDRVANADKVISVNGDEGEVIIDDSNLEHEPSVSIPTWISSVYTAGVATMRAVFDAIITRIGIMDTQLTDIEDKLDTIEEGANNYSPPDYYGDVEILETGQTIIQQGVVTNQKMSTMPAGTFKAAKVAGYPGNVTTADVKVMLSLPADTANDLSAAQSAILALQTLVASDNFNLDTVQEIVDFIEANRDDLNTYVADLNNKVDKEVGKSLISIDEIARLLTMETNAKDDQTATEIRDLLISLIGAARLPYSAIKDTPLIADNLTTQSAAQILSANMGYVINQNLIAKQNAIDSLIQLVASDNFNLDTVQEIVDFIEQNRTDLDTYVSDLAGKLDDVAAGNNVTIDKTNPNIPVINVSVPEGVEISTQAENIAGTNNTKASSPLGVVQNIQGRAGWGLTWNATTKKFELGVSSTGTGGENVRTIQQTGYADEIALKSTNEYGLITLEGGYGLSDTRGVMLKSGQSYLNVNHGSITLSVNGSVTGRDINLTAVAINMSVSEAAYLNKIGLSPESVTNRAHTDRTGVGATVTASRQLVLADTDKNKITPVNSASNVVLTIPADATLNMPIGSTINLRRRGAGSVEIIGASGVTVEGIQDTNGDYKIVRYGIVSAYKEAANLWVVYGALES